MRAPQRSPPYRLRQPISIEPEERLFVELELHSVCEAYERESIVLENPSRRAPPPMLGCGGLDRTGPLNFFGDPKFLAFSDSARAQ